MPYNVVTMFRCRAGIRVFSICGLLSLCATFGGVPAFQDSQSVRQEEAQDYYSKWLNEDVVYIIADDERAVFESLTSPEEKERFIEQFWLRRDPDPRTAENEFKTEHYRRIAYANERFASGFPGWKTARGRIYIIHGPPSQIESHSSGGAFQRPMNEGGGTTATYPFEIWRYRSIPGIGDDITLEFVDRSLSGEYRLAIEPEEKDALLHVPGAGLTLAENLGIASKADRPYFNALKRDYPMMEQGARDNPFYRYETLTMVQSPREIKYSDLKELVKVDIQFNNLPFQVREDHFQIDPDRVLVPLTIELANKNLTFVETDGIHSAQVALYGVVTTISNRIVTEFEHDLVTSYPEDRFQFGLRQKSAYQKPLLLDSHQLYRLDLVVKDLNSGQVGSVRRGIRLPSAPAERLTTSSLVLSDSISVLDNIPTDDEMFVIGDVKVLPNLDRTFETDGVLGLYFQVYNAQLDQTTLKPSLKVTYRLLSDGKVLRKTTDLNGESIQYHSTSRIVLIKLLSLQGIPSGNYRLQIELEDLLSRQQVALDEKLSVEAPASVALKSR